MNSLILEMAYPLVPFVSTTHPKVTRLGYSLPTRSVTKFLSLEFLMKL